MDADRRRTIVLPRGVILLLFMLFALFAVLLLRVPVSAVIGQTLGVGPGVAETATIRQVERFEYSEAGGISRTGIRLTVEHGRPAREATIELRGVDLLDRVREVVPLEVGATLPVIDLPLFIVDQQPVLKMDFALLMSFFMMGLTFCVALLVGLVQNKLPESLRGRIRIMWVSIAFCLLFVGHLGLMVLRDVYWGQAIWWVFAATLALLALGWLYGLGALALSWLTETA